MVAPVVWAVLLVFGVAMFFGPMDGSWDVAVSLSERMWSQERPACDPVRQEAGVPPPTTGFTAQGNKFIVAVENTSCAWIDFNIDRGWDIHYVWEFDNLLDYRRSKTLWTSVSYDAPWSLTAVGPGGIVTTSGVFRVEAGGARS